MNIRLIINIIKWTQTVWACSNKWMLLHSTWISN